LLVITGADLDPEMHGLARRSLGVNGLARRNLDDVNGLARRSLGVNGLARRSLGDERALPAGALT
jgi:hypothetical protein